MKHHIAPVGILAWICLASLMGPASCASTPGCGIASGIVKAIIDGDTVELDDGTRIRIIGVDAPETGECWASTARAAATGLLLEREVDLEFVSRCTDDYGRLLAHIIINGRSAGEILAAAGHVCAWNLEQDDWRAGEIRDAARNAATEGLGFWGECGEVPCRSR